MKKYTIVLMILAMAISLFACGKKDMISTTPTTTPTVTTTPTSPSTDPTMDTNIPDPTVDSNSTENGTVFDDVTTAPSTEGTTRG